MSNTTIVVTTSDSLIITLNFIQSCIGRYVYPCIFTLGMIGTILNILVLTQRIYLQNSCSCYIFASSIIDLPIMCIIILSHMLAIGFNLDLTTTSLFFCKFRTYIANAASLLSRFYIVLACADRWAMSSTSAQRRTFSQKKVSNIIIPFLSIAICIISAHIPVLFNIIDDRCVATPGIYSLFNNIYNIVLSGFLTPFLMIIFGFLTVQNMKHSRQRIVPHTNIHRTIATQQANKINMKSREYQISIMIIVQLCVYLITNLPFTIYLVYSAVTAFQTKSNFRLAIEKFITVIVYLLSNINFSATFYIYILTTRIFRKDLKQIFQKIRLFQICFAFQRNPTLMIPINDEHTGNVAFAMNETFMSKRQPLH